MRGRKLHPHPVRVAPLLAEYSVEPGEERTARRSSPPKLRPNEDPAGRCRSHRAARRPAPRPAGAPRSTSGLLARSAAERGGTARVLPASEGRFSDGDGIFREVTGHDQRRVARAEAPAWNARTASGLGRPRSRARRRSSETHERTGRRSPLGTRGWRFGMSWREPARSRPGEAGHDGERRLR